MSKKSQKSKVFRGSGTTHQLSSMRRFNSLMQAQTLSMKYVADTLGVEISAEPWAGAALSFGVDWDGARNASVIDTSKGYAPE